MVETEFLKTPAIDADMNEEETVGDDAETDEDEDEEDEDVEDLSDEGEGDL